MDGRPRGEDRHPVLDAIEHHTLLMICDDLGFRRIIEPYELKRSPRGTPLLQAYQVAGGSDSGCTTGWKSLDLRRIVEVKPLEVQFTPRRP